MKIKLELNVNYRQLEELRRVMAHWPASKSSMEAYEKIVEMQEDLDEEARNCSADYPEEN